MSFPIPFLNTWLGEVPQGPIPITSNVRPLSPTILREEGPIPIFGSTLRPGVVSTAPILASPGIGPMPIVIRPSPVSNFKESVPKEEYKALRKEVGREPYLVYNRQGGKVEFQDGIFTHVLKDEYIKHDSPSEHYDFLYTTVKLNKLKGNLKDNKINDVQSISESVMIDILKQEVTARCGSTAANYATLMTVIEVLKGEASAYGENIANATAKKADNKKFIEENV